MEDKKLSIWQQNDRTTMLRIKTGTDVNTILTLDKKRGEDGVTICKR